MRTTDSARTNGPIVFQNAYLIDGTGTEPRGGATLVVEADKIKAIGNGNGAAGSDELLASNLTGGAGGENGLTVIDLDGKTLMPGMILSHVHLSYNHVKELSDL